MKGCQSDKDAPKFNNGADNCTSLFWSPYGTPWRKTPTEQEKREMRIFSEEVNVNDGETSEEKPDTIAYANPKRPASKGSSNTQAERTEPEAS